MERRNLPEIRTESQGVSIQTTFKTTEVSAVRVRLCLVAVSQKFVSEINVLKMVLYLLWDARMRTAPAPAAAK